MINSHEYSQVLKQLSQGHTVSIVEVLRPDYMKV